MRGAASAEIGVRVENAARALGLESVLERKPSQLSGGQRQRVALGRAMVRDPLVFLFDEPLSNLDAKLRVETRAELARLHRRLGATTVYVTHDQEEALTLGSRVAVMHDGVVEQVAPPMAVYRTPATVFVATFVGSPAMNLFPGDVLPLVGSPAGGAPAGVIVGVRPHDVAIVTREVGEAVARVDVVEARGSELLVYLRLGAEGGGGELRVVAPPELELPVDTVVGVRFSRERLHWFDARTGRRIDA
jgi:multiple sugar transport system ATP-binding protein